MAKQETSRFLWTGKAYCAAKWCCNRNSADISLSRFPLDHRLKDWVAYANRPEFLEYSSKKVHEQRLCSEHFRSTDFIGASRRLKFNAVPSVPVTNRHLRPLVPPAFFLDPSDIAGAKALALEKAAGLSGERGSAETDVELGEERRWRRWRGRSTGTRRPEDHPPKRLRGSGRRHQVQRQGSENSRMEAQENSRMPRDPVVRRTRSGGRACPKSPGASGLCRRPLSGHGLRRRRHDRGSRRPRTRRGLRLRRAGGTRDEDSGPTDRAQQLGGLRIQHLSVLLKQGWCVYASVSWACRTLIQCSRGAS
ncbi:unnamed protein product [Ixodes pacificus]